MFFTQKGYCRFCGGNCLSLKIDRRNPHMSFCRRYRTRGGYRLLRLISKTTPIGGNIKSPTWCPKLKN